MPFFFIGQYPILLSMKGIIALDVDGTITACHTLSAAVVNYFTHLAGKGWVFLFVTGRPFTWGFHLLHNLPFRYFFAAQNGAIILEMPDKRVLAKKYLDQSVIHSMQEICLREPCDFVIYAGYERNDVCYYRPKQFTANFLDYLHSRVRAFKEQWNPVETFDEINLASFPSVKCFGDYNSARLLNRRIEEELNVYAPFIRDPFDSQYYVVQATHREVNKGQAILTVLDALKHTGMIIAAGDDLNDVPMLEKADIKIVMATAPKELLMIADILAPSAREDGIIAGLKEATGERI